MPDTQIKSVLTEPEARGLTERIKAATNQLWKLLLEAYERQAWKAQRIESKLPDAVNEVRQAVKEGLQQSVPKGCRRHK